MSIEVWFAYALAATVLLLIPGPTILLVVSQSLAHGRKVVPAATAGVALGDATAMTASLLGMGAVLAASATLFTALKWIGALYLIWLAWKLWRSAGQLSRAALAGALPEKPRPMALKRIFWNAYVVTALNPKGIVFFVAFLPQFVDPAHPMVPQLLLLGGTFLVLATINAAAYGYLAGSLRSKLTSPRLMANAQRVGAGFLFSAGLLTAAWSRAQ